MRDSRRNNNNKQDDIRYIAITHIFIYGLSLLIISRPANIEYEHIVQVEYQSGHNH